MLKKHLSKKPISPGSEEALDTFTCIRTRREIRDYLDKPIQEENLKRILEAGRLAPSSKKQNNIFLVLCVIALIFKLFVFTQEASDPADFGDEIPVAIGLILVILNRFV